MRTLEQIIAEHPFWHRLKSDYFPRINQCASELHFGVQQQIFLEGSKADRFYLIHAGRVALETFAPGIGVNHNSNDWRGRSAGVVIAVSTVSVAFQRAIHR